MIQNSKKKGPEYGKEFYNCLPKVFKYLGEKCTDEKLFRSSERILSIWEERGVYDKATINDYKSRLNKDKELDEDAVGEPSKVEKKRKVEEENNHHSHRSSSNKKSRSNDVSKNAETATKVNGTPVAETTVSQSPHVPLGDPPEPEELIEVLTKLMDNSAASDVVVREQIANFPKEISDLSFVAKLEDKDQAKKFSEKVRLILKLVLYFGSIKFVQRGFLTFVVVGMMFFFFCSFLSVFLF